MNKHIIGFMLCCCLLMFSGMKVYADESEVQEEVQTVEITIDTAEELLAFAENCRLDSYSQNLVVSLEADIDLTGVEFESIPIFSGIFEGNDHSISGLNMTAEGSVQGLFRYLTETAVVQDLNVQGNIQPGGSRSDIGGIAGSNEGKILNCSFEGTISGDSNIGGLVGLNEVTGIIEDCYMKGNLSGNHFVGGIAGENYGVIRDCINHAEINTTAMQNSVEISDITIDTLVSSESANTVTDIGGITGISSGVIRNCTNKGNVGYQLMGYNIGGIAGTQSGYIVNCKNYADIQGRKEVGGIVGQMEPVALIEYSEDTLQILQGQLSTMSGLVDRASSNVQTNAEQVRGQLGLLENQTETAKSAADILIIDKEELENFDFPDSDTIQAARNNLSSAIGAIPGTIDSVEVTVQNTVSSLSRDMRAIINQINVMEGAISKASDNLGGSIKDVSDTDTPEDLTGKVESSHNQGGVLADLNVGGIAGAMAMENDLDVEEDWQIIGDNSLNFESELRAVILDCINEGVVAAKKQNAGGIVGWQSMGLVKNSLNTAALDTEGADHVGGISGMSTGYIRSCSTKCEIAGSSYVGGIAGSATIVTDSHSMVKINGGSERLGAVLGLAEEGVHEEENPISANFYFSVSEDFGAIDGISYTGQAEPLSMNEFLALENLPNQFKNVTVRFEFEDGTQRQIKVELGGKFADNQIPKVPVKEGYVGEWEGLAEADLSNIVFDMTFNAVYTGHKTTIQSEEVRENGLPILLIEGEFTSGAAVKLSESDSAPVLDEGQTLIEIWSVDVSEAEKVTNGRYLIPADCKVENLHLLVQGEDGNWNEVAYTVDGSYLVFGLSDGDTQVASIYTEKNDQLLIAAVLGIAVIVIAVVIVLFYFRKKVKPLNN